MIDSTFSKHVIHIDQNNPENLISKIKELNSNYVIVIDAVEFERMLNQYKAECRKEMSSRYRSLAFAYGG
jgi:Ni,Fe-hydrogenase maturation factor